MTNGTLYVGHNRLAGEFGHTVACADGPLCKCGCLESVASMAAVIERVKEALFREEVDPVLAGVIAADGGQVDLEAVLRAVERGGPAALRIVGEAARHLGIGLANLVNIFDPEAIVIGSSIPATPDYETYLRLALEAMEGGFLHERQRRPPVLISRFKERVRLMGATAAVLTEVLGDWPEPGALGAGANGGFVS